MDISFIDGHCGNCAYKFRNAGQIFKKITIDEEIPQLTPREISILDAVLYIYGLSASNLASAYLDDATKKNVSAFYKISETSDYIVQHGLAMCSNCVSVFKEVYVAFYGLKTLSNRVSILSKAIKKFSPTFIKIEDYSEIEDTGKQTCDASSSVHLEETLPESSVSYAEETNELFQEFNFENNCDSFEIEEHDLKSDPLADTTSFENALDVVEAVDSEPEKDLKTRKRRKCRRDKESIPNITSKTKIKGPDHSPQVTRNFTFTKSKRGRDILVDEEKNTYEFCKPGLHGKKLWRCTKYYSLDKCKGRCHTIGDEMTIITPHTHVHTESIRDLQIREFKNGIRGLTSNTSNTPGEIIASTLQEQDSIAPEIDLRKQKKLIRSIYYAKKYSKVAASRNPKIAAKNAKIIRTFKLIKSDKGKDLVVDEEKNVYDFSKPGAGGKKIWRCTKYASDKCKGRCHTIGDEMTIITPHTHVHAESARDLKIREFKNKIKCLASKTSNTPGEILASALQEQDDIAPEIDLLKQKSLISSIYRVRRKCKFSADPDSSMEQSESD